MSDQLRLMGASNTSINGRTENTDIHSRSISNLINLTPGQRNWKVRKKKPRQKENYNNVKKEDTGEILSVSKNNFQNGTLVESLTLKFAKSLSGIKDVHLKVGSLVTLPDTRKRQIQDIMDKLKKPTMENKHSKHSILTPDIIRDFHSEFHSLKNKTTQTLTENSVSESDKTMKSTASTIIMDKRGSLNSTSPSNNKYQTSTFGYNTTELLRTKRFPESVTAPVSSEESNTDIPLDQTTAEIIDTFTDNGGNFDINDNTTKRGSELNNVIANHTLLDITTPTIKNGEASAVKEVDTIMFPSKRLDYRKRRRERQRFCRAINFILNNTGYPCCIKTLACFDNLPEKIDETVFHHGEAPFLADERLHLCHDLDDSLLCMGRVLDRPNCRKVSKVIDNKIQPQMNQLKLFYQSTCSAGPGIPTIAPIPTTTKRHNSSGLRGFGLFPSPLISFIGGAVAGLIVLAIVMFLIIYCRRRCKRRKRNAANGENTGRRSRHKDAARRKSSVYEEINVDQMVANAPPNPTGSKKVSVGSRKLPSAPSKEKRRPENHYYLSPTSSLPEEKQTNEKDKGVPNFGYLDLQTDENGQSYAKLKPEGEYITPNEIASSPPPPPKPKDGVEEYHMYFVLEKESEENNENEVVEEDSTLTIEMG